MSAGGGHALVTGGAGFIGHHLVHALLGAGLEVTVLDNLSTGDASRLSRRVRLLQEDVRDTSAVERALDGVDHVFHLAAVVTIRGSVDRFVADADVNLGGTLSLLEALSRTRVKTAMFASSMGVYGPAPAGQLLSETMCPAPISPYGISKLAAEQYWQLLAPRGAESVSALRFFNTWGPGQKISPYVGVITYFAELLRRGESPTIFGDGLQRRDFVHVADIVAACMATLSGAGAGLSINVGTGQGTTVLELTRQLIAAIAPGVEPRFEPAREGELVEAVADIQRAREHLGYAPRFPRPNLDLLFIGSGLH